MHTNFKNIKKKTKDILKKENPDLIFYFIIYNKSTLSITFSISKPNINYTQKPNKK